MAIETLTFGCRLNAYEGEVMKAEAEKAGLDNAIIINTCAVTAEAVRQAKQAVRKARRDNPEARIIVTGCAAQTEARSFGDMDEVDEGPALPHRVGTGPAGDLEFSDAPVCFKVELPTGIVAGCERWPNINGFAW